MSDYQKPSNLKPQTASAQPRSVQSEGAASAPKQSVKAPKETVKKDGFEGFEMAVPETMRAMAERAVSQSREAYERAKGAMEDAVESLEKSLDSAGEGTAAIQRKVIEIAQANVNSGFDLVKELASARDLAQVVELQTAYARKQFDVMTRQAEEVRSLTSKMANDTVEPLKSQVSRSFGMLKRAS